MTTPEIQSAGAATPIIQVASQGPGVFANSLFLGTDGISVFLTFSQASPVQAPGPQPSQSVPSQPVLIQPGPMVAVPVAKIVLPIQFVPQVVASLKDMMHHIEQQSKQSS